MINLYEPLSNIKITKANTPKNINICHHLKVLVWLGVKITEISALKRKRSFLSVLLALVLCGLIG